MRELTEAEKEALKATYSWVDTHNNTKYQIYTIGFSNGLETQDSRIAELERQLAEIKLQYDGIQRRAKYTKNPLVTTGLACAITGKSLKELTEE